MSKKRGCRMYAVARLAEKYRPYRCGREAMEAVILTLVERQETATWLHEFRNVPHEWVGISVRGLSKTTGYKKDPIRDALRTLRAEALIVLAPKSAKRFRGATTGKLGRSRYDARALIQAVDNWKPETFGKARYDSPGANLAADAYEGGPDPEAEEAAALQELGRQQEAIRSLNLDLIDLFSEKTSPAPEQTQEEMEAELKQLQERHAAEGVTKPIEAPIPPAGAELDPELDRLFGLSLGSMLEEEGAICSEDLKTRLVTKYRRALTHEQVDAVLQNPVYRQYPVGVDYAMAQELAGLFRPRVRAVVEAARSGVPARPSLEVQHGV